MPITLFRFNRCFNTLSIVGDREFKSGALNIAMPQADIILCSSCLRPGPVLVLASMSRRSRSHRPDLPDLDPRA